MTVLYKPVLIESAEQAEALPIGTVVVDQTRQVVEVKGDYGWTDEYPHYGNRDADLIGWTALVPIEVEDEWDVVGYAAVGHRYVTPWEEV